MASCGAHDGNNIESMKHKGGIIKNTKKRLSLFEPIWIGFKFGIFFAPFELFSTLKEAWMEQKKEPSSSSTPKSEAN